MAVCFFFGGLWIQDKSNKEEEEEEAKRKAEQQLWLLPENVDRICTKKAARKGENKSRDNTKSKTPQKNIFFILLAFSFWTYIKLCRGR